jgi:hypothetical protein
MKKLTTALVLALFVSGSLPVPANANSTVEAAGLINPAGYSATASDRYRIYGSGSHEFKRFVNRGHVDILVVGDGSTDLDLYVYIGGEREVSDGNSDDEKVCLSSITRSGYITIKVVNRGGYANNYWLIIK